ncbi:MAG: 2-C-methyl-D-erythritol 4-phosphate cytidylyltransferase [Pyrinomonadaceae bacterium]|nr:2-C-methyl-D-erythritol 4-phosphate cytidylyltransferase [Pyrinomonadaceae bacterium]MCX7639870.1 2-C-methyl-D-erythritol 4-phosphate cytidylyltransferase [Pyrinomonadaceae bacterium]MDW8304042.1 2-C-methyl-D-erythritol 4-phosphate cytidylyltransferase [Acidobacteriota bacterium]
MNSAVIVAAGSGSRFGGKTPKQFVNLGKKPLIFHTLEKFDLCELVDEIVLVLAEDKIDYFRQLGYQSKKKLKLVEGGKTRAESVFKGLSKVDPRTQIVAIHDGARPLVFVEEISRTLEVAIEKGAACLVAPINDTIKKVCDGKITETIDRHLLRRALTPQAFRFEILLKAFDGVCLNESITDESLLVERLGIKVFAVEGSARNIKITTPEDLAFANFILQGEKCSESVSETIFTDLKKVKS